MRQRRNRGDDLTNRPVTVLPVELDVIGTRRNIKVGVAHPNGLDVDVAQDIPITNGRQVTALIFCRPRRLNKVPVTNEIGGVNPIGEIRWWPRGGQTQRPVWDERELRRQGRILHSDELEGRAERVVHTLHLDGHVQILPVVNRALLCVEIPRLTQIALVARRQLDCIATATATTSTRDHVHAQETLIITTGGRRLHSKLVRASQVVKKLLVSPHQPTASVCVELEIV